MRLLDDMTPGRVVELDGEFYLVEKMNIRVVMQRITSAAPAIDELMESGHTTPHCPVFMTIEGEYDSEMFTDKIRPLYTEDEL